MKLFNRKSKQVSDQIKPQDVFQTELATLSAEAQVKAENEARQVCESGLIIKNQHRNEPLPTERQLRGQFSSFLNSQQMAKSLELERVKENYRNAKDVYQQLPQDKVAFDEKIKNELNQQKEAEFTKASEETQEELDELLEQQDEVKTEQIVAKNLLKQHIDQGNYRSRLVTTVYFVLAALISSGEVHLNKTVLEVLRMDKQYTLWTALVIGLGLGIINHLLGASLKRKGWTWLTGGLIATLLIVTYVMADIRVSYLKAQGKDIPFTAWHLALLASLFILAGIVISFLYHTKDSKATNQARRQPPAIRKAKKALAKLKPIIAAKKEALKRLLNQLNEKYDRKFQEQNSTAHRAKFLEARKAYLTLQNQLDQRRQQVTNEYHKAVDTFRETIARLSGKQLAYWSNRKLPLQENPLPVLEDELKNPELFEPLDNGSVSNSRVKARTSSNGFRVKSPVTAVLLFLLAWGLTACNSGSGPPKTFAFGILIDTSGSMVGADINLNTHMILKRCGLSGENPSIHGAEVYVSYINSVSANAYKTARLKQGDPNQNSFDRADEVSHFGERLENLLAPSRLVTTGANSSSIYLPTRHLFGKLARSQADEKITIICSDLLEFGFMADFYTNLEELDKEPEKVREKLEARWPLPDLSHIDQIQVLSQPVEADDYYINIVQRFYKEVWEANGAGEVLFGASLHW